MAWYKYFAVVSFIFLVSGLVVRGVGYWLHTHGKGCKNFDKVIGASLALSGVGFVSIGVALIGVIMR